MVQNADTDSRLRAVVTGTNPGGSMSATSAQTAVVQAAVYRPGEPADDHRQHVQGSTLTAGDGVWGGHPDQLRLPVAAL